MRKTTLPSGQGGRFRCVGTIGAAWAHQPEGAPWSLKRRTPLRAGQASVAWSARGVAQRSVLATGCAHAQTRRRLAGWRALAPPTTPPFTAQELKREAGRTCVKSWSNSERRRDSEGACGSVRAGVGADAGTRVVSAARTLPEASLPLYSMGSDTGAMCCGMFVNAEGGA